MTTYRLTYAQALAELDSRGRFGIRLGLGRTKALLARLDHPERAFRGALIAGTNGKGSVLALMGSALTAAGYNVRINLNGLSDKTAGEALLSQLQALEVHARKLEKDLHHSLTTRGGI